MDDKTKKLIYEAFLHASSQMGERIKEMSCFVKNWKDQKKNSFELLKIK